MSELKTKKNSGRVEDFLDTIEEETKRQDCYAIMQLMEDVSGDKASMWGDVIVGVGSYHYKYASGREGDWFKIGFSPRKQNISIYVPSGFENMQGFLNSLGKHKTNISCLYIKRLSDVDLDVFRQIIETGFKEMDECNYKV